MRPYVICHMLPSIDGRIVIRDWKLPQATREYERTAATFDADAWIIGRISMEPYAGKARVPKRGSRERIAREDFVAPHDGRQRRHALALRRREPPLPRAQPEAAVDGKTRGRHRVAALQSPPAMRLFEIIIALLLGGAILAALARRIATPYPALVAIAGAALALFPHAPSLMLDPQLVLALFVAPVLLDAAFDASQRDLRENWRAVLSLAVGAVVLTVLVVAVVAHALVPGLPWAAAITLGAIVAPPDAAAATAVLKQLRPPNRPSRARRR